MNQEFPDPVLRRWLGAIGLAHVVLASAVLAGRFAGWTGLVTLTPSGAPMAFATAITFFLGGIAFFAYANGWKSLGRVLGSVITLTGTGTLVLYFASERLKLGSFIYDANGRTAGRGFDGRMSPGTAVAVTIFGLSLVVMAARKIKTRTLIVGSSLLLVVSFTALCGYLTGLRTTIAWWRIAGMALHTTVGFMMASAGILVWVVRRVPTEEREKAYSLPFFATAAGLIVAVTWVSLVSNEAERESERRVEHTWEVSATIDHFVSAMARVEATANRYLATGEMAALAHYDADQAEVRQQLDSLDRLTADNSKQVANLQQLRPLVARKFEINEAQLRARRELERVNPVQIIPEFPDLLPQLKALTEALAAEETRLLARREAGLSAAEHSDSLILVAGVVVTTALLGAAFFLVNRAQLALRDANKVLERRVSARTLELQLVNDSLVESERSLQFLADTIPQLVWTTDTTGKLASMNRRWAEYTGVPCDELLARTDMGILHPDDAAESGKTWAELIAAGKEGGGEVRLRAKDGSWRWHLWRGRPQRGSDQAIFRWVGTSTDIHEQKLAGALLEQRVVERTRELNEIRASLEDAYRFQSAVLDSTSFALIVTSGSDGIIRIFNAGAERLLGWRRDEVVGRHKTSLFYDMGEVTIRAQKLSTLLGREIKPGREVFITPAGADQPIETEWSFVRKDGSRVPALLNLQPLLNSSGETTGYLGVLYDNSERRAAEAAQRESEDRLRLFAAHAPASVAMFDRNMRYLVVSQRWLIDYKLEGCDLVGRSHYEIFPEIDQAWKAIHQRCLAGAVERSEAEAFTRLDGTKQWLQWEIRPWHDYTGEIGGVVMFTQDITDRKAMETNLALARDQALEASRLKSQFLATMSHEIRTPMNGVLGMMALMQETRLSEEQREMARVVQSSAESLLTIINDILDFSRIEAGQLRIDPVEFDLRRLIQGTAALLQPRAQEKKLELVCEIDSQLAGHFLGDAGRLRQVVVNLLGNALKFTEKGQVVLKAQMLRGDPRGVIARVSVQDTGIGIPGASREQLFQPFTQGDGSVTRRFGGTGLGLAISRQLIALLGGTIGFESELGRGSLFWFEVALERVVGSSNQAEGEISLDFGPAAEARKTRADSRSRKLQILLAEDNPANQLVARMMLTKIGHNVEIAANGEVALAMLGLRRYDVVLMDCQMPVLDGYEATRRIRAGTLPRVDAKIPVIAITAHAMGEDRQKCLAAGMNDYVTKPISIVELSEAIERCGIVGPRKMRIEARPNAAERSVLNEKVREMVSGLPGNSGPSLWPEMIELFQREEISALAEIDKLAGQENLPGLAAMAHRLAGSTASIGGEVAQEAAAALERAARTGKRDEIGPRVAALRVASEDLRIALQADMTTTT